MQSLFDPSANPPTQETKRLISPTLQLIVGLLAGILVVRIWIAYRYDKELERQKDERCSKAHAQLMASGVYGQSTRGIKEACGTEELTPAEKAQYESRKTETEQSIREYECDDALQKYGVESAVSKQFCPGTKVGKKAGF